MATRMSIATGNWTTAGTWGTIDTTSLLTSQANNTALTSTYVESATFTPGAITIDGIAVKIASRSASPTNKIYIRLAQAGALVAGTEVSIDVADLPLCTTTDLAGGWVFFKFSSSVLLVAATAYSVSAKTDDAAMVNLFRNATAGNWARLLRTTTTGAPAAGDDMIIIGEHTGSGTGNSFTVTMNETATTDYGSNESTRPLEVPALAIGKRGTLTWGTTAATDYILRLSGKLIMYADSTHTIGTTGTPLPRGSTAQLQFDNTGGGTEGGVAVRGNAIFTSQGLSSTSGKDFVSAYLAADAAANATSLNVTGYDTGWLDNAAIGVASTSQTIGDGETGTLNGNASSTTLTVDGFLGTAGGLLVAHSGTAPTRAEIILINRPIRILQNGGSSCIHTFGAEGVVDLDWVEFMGAQTTSVINVETTTGSFSARYCAFNGGGTTGSMNLTLSAAALNNVTVQYCTGWRWNLTFNATTGTSNTIDNCIGLGQIVVTFSCNDVGSTFTNNTVTGQMTINELAGIVGTINNLTVHSGSTLFNSIRGIGTIYNLTAWRGASGLLQSGDVEGLIIDGLTLFGNSIANINFTTNSTSKDFKIIDLVAAGDTTFATPIGLRFGANDISFVTFDNPQFSPSGGIYADHTTADISVTTATWARIILNNPIMEAATQVSGNSLLKNGGGLGGIFASRLGQTDGVNKSWLSLGTIETDATTYRTAAPSQKLTPNNAARKLESAVALAACDDGATKTVTVYVQKDGSYNGNAPRLILKADASMGIPDDVVCDTLSVASGNWEALTYTTSAALQNGAFTFVIDCDGTAGSIYIDDWSVI